MDPVTSKGRFVFSTNCSDPILDEPSLFPELIEAALLSQSHTSNGALARMRRMRSTGSLLMSDNGNFSRMSTIAASYAVAARALTTEALAQVADLGAVQADLLERKDALIRKISGAASSAAAEPICKEITSDQLRTDPHYLIGLEDLMIPVMTMTGLLAPPIGSGPRSVLKYQRATLRAYLDQKAGRFGGGEQLQGVRKYVVLHAYDYASARQGARVMSSAEVDGIAIGFGAPMTSKRFIREIAIRGRRFDLGTELPEAYLLAMAIIAGTLDGLDGRSKPIHVLGLGSPIVIAMLGYLLRSCSSISMDATSTFKDAMVGTIYGEMTAYMKLNMYKVAAFALRDDVPYRSESPFFLEFERRFPSDWSELRKRLGVTPSTNIGALAEALRRDAASLEALVPYFCPMRRGSDPMMTALRVARSGSNYWLLQRLCAVVRSKIDDEVMIRSWFEAEMNRYVHAAAPKWALAVRKLTEMATELSL